MQKHTHEPKTVRRNHFGERKNRQAGQRSTSTGQAAQPRRHLEGQDHFPAVPRQPLFADLKQSDCTGPQLEQEV